MTFQLKILGSNSAIPAYGRNHTAQVLTVYNNHYLIDCGEATQHQIARYKGKLLKINAIFISHLHGDHYLGLMGVLSSMHLQGRKNSLDLYGPPGLMEIITTQLKYSQTVFNFDINLVEIDTTLYQRIHEDKRVEVYTLPLNHRIPCTGFYFKELPYPYRIIKEKIPENFPLQYMALLKKGEDITDENGQVLYKNEALTKPPRKSRSYAYFSDTLFVENLADYVKGVDLLYHEATFLEENEIWANKTFHSTTTQAAEMAKTSRAKQLIIGHFSARYKDLTPFLEEARAVFKNTILADEGTEISVEFDDQ